MKLCQICVISGWIFGCDLLGTSNHWNYSGHNMGNRSIEGICWHRIVSRFWIAVEKSAKFYKFKFLFILRFAAVNCGIVYIYCLKFQEIDEEAYGGVWELLKEGFMTSFACFLVAWIVFYTGMHFDDSLNIIATKY